MEPLLFTVTLPALPPSPPLPPKLSEAVVPSVSIAELTLTRPPPPPMDWLSKPCDWLPVVTMTPELETLTVPPSPPLPPLLPT